MAEKISFEIEDAEKLLNQLQKLNEIFQQDWSRVLNQWENIKTTWQDKQVVVFEAQFQKILSIYQCSEKECEEYIVEIKRQIEIARKHQQIPLPPEFTNTRSNLAQTSIKRDQTKTSSPASKEVSTNRQIPHSEVKNTPPAAIQNDGERKQTLRYSPVDNTVIQEQQPDFYTAQPEYLNQNSPPQQSDPELSRGWKDLKTQPNSKKGTNSASRTDNIPEGNSSKFYPTNTANESENWRLRQELVETQMAVLDDIKRNAFLNETNIQRWEIPTELTQGQVESQYIYLPREQETQFATDNNNLNGNKFTDFITYPEKTLNLYNPPGVDESAAAIAAYQIHDKNQAMINSIAKKQWSENKDDFLLRIETSTNADYDALSSEYFSYLNHLQSLPSEILQTILAVLGEKSTEIDKIAKMLEGVINLPKIIFNNCHIGDNTVSEQHGINFNIGGDLSGVVNLGQISGNVTNIVQQLPDSPDPEQPGIKELLTQLQEAITAETNMTDEDKAEALEQIQALAEAGQKPKEGNMQKQAKKATTMLKGIIFGLPAAAQLVEAFNTIVPRLSTFFGF